ncbi:Small acidic protein [Desmophyllum pertusum]|uniref:Small acidic protein n=1 Tax=Desmophyllum pertusum TaxID=174260 RepID=A0A9W9YXD8_9CNID|nr:Small acidic protein [Desmophyllum pertusum]
MDEASVNGHEKAKVKKDKGHKRKLDEDSASVSEERNGNEKKNGKSDEKSSSELGQWGKTEFGSEERQEKFLRLMGAFKNKPSTQSPADANVSPQSSQRCMTKDTESSLTQRLEQQYESAMDCSRNRRGLGLGYNPDQDPSNKTFYIDKNWL